MHKLIGALLMMPALVIPASTPSRAADPQAGPKHEVATRIANLETRASAVWLPPAIGLLPPIESITAKTDVRGFLAPGVPRDLMLAALRRVWVIDPSIRDFRGLQENDWDFEGANGPLGFGQMQAEDGAIELAAGQGTY